MSMGLTIIIAVVFSLIAIGVIGYFIIIFNNLIRLKKNIDKSWSNINVLLKQRYDELPKLIATVKGYMKYERKTFKLITDARSLYRKAKNIKQKATADNMMTEALKTLFAVAENYPKLQADRSFSHLQTRITGIENELADRREFYNDSVTEYNIKINSIPDRFIAGLLKYEEKEVFKVSEKEMKDVKVDLEI